MQVTTEYQMLAIMTLLFIFGFVPSSVAKFQTYGGKWLASNRSTLPNAVLPEWGNRVERAYANLKDYFPGFVVGILVLGATGKFDEGTKYASIIYVIARIMHFTAYGLGNFPARFMGYVVAMACNVFLLLKVLF